MLSALGESVLFNAAAKDATGQEIPAVSFSWASSNSQVAEVDSEGCATSTGNGEATISATAGGVTGDVTLRVAQSVASMTLALDADTISLGGSRLFMAVPLDSNGNPAEDALVSWQSSDASVVSVAQTGEVRALRTGEVVITATSEGISADAEVVVWNVAPDDVESVLVAAFASEFGLEIPKSNYFRTQTLSIWTSVAYVDMTRYRLYVLADGTIESDAVSIKTRPSGEMRAAVILVDYATTNFGEVLNSIWLPILESINAEHAAYAVTMGFGAPLVQFSNTVFLVPPSAITDPASRDDVIAYVETQGFMRSDFDMFLSIDLQPGVPRGGFAFMGGEFAHMGCFFGGGCQTGSPINLDATILQQVAFAMYQHEVGHLWGWEHGWSECSCRPFITVPALFGWTDVDGDGVPEIIDPTPYGRLN